MKNNNLVNLFIVGAAKCGTTSLYEYLAQHPQIYMCPVKEPHFFSNKVENSNKSLYERPAKGKKYHTKIIKDRAVYDSLFDEGEGLKIRGEASPTYLWDPESALKIFNYNSHAKIIVILRNPVDRLISSYQMNYSLGLQSNTNDFLDTIKNEYKKEKKIWGYDGIYLDLGLYNEQISRYSALFPSQQLLILKFDDLIKNTSETIKRVLNFLDVDQKYLEVIDLKKVHNETLTIKYPLIKKLRKVKIISKLGHSLSSKFGFLKKMTHSKGYSSDLVIDENARAFLNDFYHNDLVKLKENFKIEF
jgi:hypothetical protein